MKKNINDNTLVRVKVPKALYEAIQSKLAEYKESEMEEGKKQLAFVIPCPDCHDIEEEAEHFQYLLDKAGVKAKVKANQVGEEAEVYTKDEKKARKVIEKNGYQIGWINLTQQNDDIEDNGEGDYGMQDEAVGEPGTQIAAEKMMHAISSGDPLITGFALVGAIVAGIVAGPKVIDTLKGYYKALTQKDPAKAEELKKAAEAAKVNISAGDSTTGGGAPSGINESNKRNKK